MFLIFKTIDIEIISYERDLIYYCSVHETHRKPMILKSKGTQSIRWTNSHIWLFTLRRDSCYHLLYLIWMYLSYIQSCNQFSSVKTHYPYRKISNLRHTYFITPFAAKGTNVARLMVNKVGELWSLRFKILTEEKTLYDFSTSV